MGTSPVRAFRVEFDHRAADLAITALERHGVGVRLADSIRQADGYRLLFEYVALTEGLPTRPDAVGHEFVDALDAVSRGEPDPRFQLGRTRSLRSRYRETLRAFRRTERRAKEQVEGRLRDMLPAGTRFSSTAYLVVGGDAWGMAFSDRDDIAIRIDDFVPSEKADDPDVSRLRAVLCHELFHVGFRAAGGPPAWPKSPDFEWAKLAETYGPSVVGEVWRASGDAEWRMRALETRLEAWVLPPTWDRLAVDRYVTLLSRLQNEGLAVYTEAPLRDDDAGIARWMAFIDDDFAFLAHITNRLDRGATADEIDELAAIGFRDNGPLYRIGFRIAERIDTFTGRRALLGTIEGGVLEFFATYFETHPYGPGQMDPRTEEEVRRLIREIRAVGRFDPEAG